MTDQDREKKIAEIRETATCFMGAGNDAEYDRALNTLKENAGEWIPFLILELERIEHEYAEERAAHNAHVTELCELEQERNMYKASSEVFYERLKKAWEERDKLIEGSRSIRNELDRLSRESRQKWKHEGDMYEQGRADAYDEADMLMRDILKECGVTVE